MNETLKATLSVIHAIAHSAKVTGKMGIADILQSRVVVAGTESTLLGFAQKLASILDADLKYIGRQRWIDFMQACNADDAQNVLAWLRQNAMATAMICTLKKEDGQEGDFSDDMLEIIESLDLPAIISNQGVALPTRDIDVPVTITCLSPFSHGGDTKAGNNTLFNRKDICSTTGAKLSLPAYSANGFRGHLRDILSRHFIQSLGLPTGKTMRTVVKDWFLFMLFEGGRLQENAPESKAFAAKLGRSGTINCDGEYEFRNTIPFLSLFGTNVGNKGISGRLDPRTFRPYCREWGFGDDAPPFAELITWEFITRRNDFLSEAEKGEHHGMIANTECLCEGTILHGGADFRPHVTDIERSCLLRGIELMNAQKHIGAGSAKDYGLIRMEYEADLTGELYEEFLSKNHEHIMDYLTDVGAIADAQHKLNLFSAA